MKIKGTYTLDEESVEYLKTKANQSDFINELILYKKNKDNDILAVLDELDKKQNDIDNRREEVIAKLKVKIEEGNKKEREESQILLAKMEEKKKAKREKVVKYAEAFRQKIPIDTITELVNKCDIYNLPLMVEKTIELRDKYKFGVEFNIKDMECILIKLQHGEANAFDYDLDRKVQIIPISPDILRDIIIFNKTGEVLL